MSNINILARDEVKRHIDYLGTKKPEGIAKCLFKRYAFGIKDDPLFCPVATYVREESGHVISISRRYGVKILNHQDHSMLILPESVSEFIKQFDAGEFRELNLSEFQYLLQYTPSLSLRFKRGWSRMFKWASNENLKLATRTVVPQSDGTVNYPLGAPTP